MHERPDLFDDPLVPDFSVRFPPEHTCPVEQVHRRIFSNTESAERMERLFIPVDVFMCIQVGKVNGNVVRKVFITGYHKDQPAWWK